MMIPWWFFTALCKEGVQMSVPFVTACDFEIIDSTTEDQTQKVQDAVNSLAGKGGLVWLGNVHVMVTAFSLPRGVELRGVGIMPGSTWLEQFADYDGSMILHDPTLPTNEWQHWGGVSHMRLSKQAGWTPGTKTGHGIFMDVPVGENFICHDLIINGFPEAGLRYAQGGTPVWIHDIHGSKNGTYLVDTYMAPGRRLQNCEISHVSADNNTLGAIRIGRTGHWSESTHIHHVKAEAFLANTHPCVIDIDQVAYNSIRIEQVGGQVGSAAMAGLDAIIKVRNGFGGGRLHWKDVYIGGYPNLFRNTVGAGFTIPLTSDHSKGHAWDYPVTYPPAVQGW
jgi:hypothetical protein